MKKIYSIVFLSLFTVSLFAQTQYKDYADGKIYVRMKSAFNPLLNKNLDKSNLPQSVLKDIEAAFGASGVQKVSKPYYQAKDWEELQRTFLIEFTNFADVDRLMREIEKTGKVDFAEKVPLMYLDQVPPNDLNTTQQWFLPQINATGAWNVFYGNSNATVAVVDNAVQTNHTDLTANIWVNPNEIAGNGIDDDNNGFIDDINGFDVGDNDNNPMPPNNTFDHGTHCAGIVGARTHNGTGIAAIGYNIKIIAVKATPSSGDASQIYSGYLGIVYAVNAGAKVISCSWGGTGSSQTEQSVINFAWSRRSLVVAAAGNSSTNALHYPSAYNNCYAVASSTTGDVKSGFSNYGTWVDITAPGSNIRSTLPTNTYGNMSGTSMACPLVAGLAGLMVAYNPALIPQDIISCINSTATNINAANPSYIGQLGAGRIDAQAAMICVQSTFNKPPIADFFATEFETCPAGSIQFKDNSAYVPTSWSWTFQGGTPATSTAQNPLITYAAPGTYSVQLVVSNANGNDTEVKTSYIKVAGPINLPITEGFTSTAFPPANWSEKDVFSDSLRWIRNTSVGGFSATGQCAYFDNYAVDVGGKRDQLRAPKLNFTGLGSATMTFDVAYRQYDNTYSDTLAVMVSTDCGQTFTQVYMKGGSTLATVAGTFTTAVFQPTATQWRNESVNLNSFVGQGNVMIAFENRGHYGQDVYIDNINITGTAAGVPPTANFTSSATKCTGTSVQFTDASTGAPTSWSWAFQGGTPATSTSQNPSITWATAGTYTANLIATNSNGSSTPYTQTITIVATPTANAGSNKTITCTSPVVSLNGSGGGTYSWSGPSGWTSTLVNPNVFNPGTYSLTVTNSGCTSAQTTVSVTTNTTVPNVSSSTTSTLTCINTTGTLNGTSSTTGATYSWSGPGVVSGGTSSTATANAAGTYTLTVTDPANGCTNSSTVVLTANTTPPAVPTITQAGNVLTSSSASNNQWYFNGSIMPGETNQTLTVTQNGNYTVEVTDPSNGCTSTSTVFVVNSIGINENSIQINFNVYPNPNEGEFILTLNLAETTNIALNVFNLLGENVYSDKIINANGNIKKNIKLERPASGTYLLSVDNGKKKTYKKIIIQ